MSADTLYTTHLGSGTKGSSGIGTPSTVSSAIISILPPTTASTANFPLDIFPSPPKSYAELGLADQPESRSQSLKRLLGTDFKLGPPTTQQSPPPPSTSSCHRCQQRYIERHRRSSEPVSSITSPLPLPSLEPYPPPQRRFSMSFTTTITLATTNCPSPCAVQERVYRTVAPRAGEQSINVRKRRSSLGSRGLSCELANMDGARGILQALGLDGGDWTDTITGLGFDQDKKGGHDGSGGRMISGMNKLRLNSRDRDDALTRTQNKINGVASNEEESIAVWMSATTATTTTIASTINLNQKRAGDQWSSLTSSSPPFTSTSPTLPPLPPSSTLPSVSQLPSISDAPLWPSLPSGPSSPDFNAQHHHHHHHQHHPSSSGSPTLPPGRVLSGFSDNNYSSCSFSVDDHEIYHQRYSKHIEAKQQKAKLDSSPTLPFIPLSQESSDPHLHHHQHTPNPVHNHTQSLPTTPPSQHTITLARTGQPTTTTTTSIPSLPTPGQETKGSVYHRKQDQHDKDSSSVIRDVARTGGNDENKHLQNIPRTQPSFQSLNTRQERFFGLNPSASHPIDTIPSNEDQHPLESLAPSYAESISLATTPSSVATSTTTSTVKAGGAKEGQKATTSTPIDPLASPVSIYSQHSIKPSSSPKSGSEGVTSMPFAINNRSEDWDRGMSCVFFILSTMSPALLFYVTPLGVHYGTSLDDPTHLTH